MRAFVLYPTQYQRAGKSTNGLKKHISCKTSAYDVYLLYKYYF